MALPQDVSTATNDMDPLVMLVVLAYGRARAEDKMFEVVHVCRANGKSWTQIGEVLGVANRRHGSDSPARIESDSTRQICRSAFASPRHRAESPDA
jgi:hypothetical protein